MKLSVIICTFKRPDQVRDAVESILGQTRLPDELLIIDDDALPAPPFRQECEDAGIVYRYVRKQPPDLTRSRNLAMDLAQGDVLAFFDDDVILEPQCLAEMMRPLEADSDGSIAAIAANITNYPPVRPRDRWRKRLESLLLIDDPRQGRVLPSLFYSEYDATYPDEPALVPVDFMPGCGAAYRRSLVDDLRFVEDFDQVGAGEDKEFSMRAAARGRLLVAARARLVHLETPVMRGGKEREGRRYVLGRYLLFRRFRAGRPAAWLAFSYAMAAYTLLRLLAFVASPSGGKARRLAGMAQAYGQILTGRVPNPYDGALRQCTVTWTEVPGGEKVA